MIELFLIIHLHLSLLIQVGKHFVLIHVISYQIIHSFLNSNFESCSMNSDKNQPSHLIKFFHTFGFE